MLIFVFIVGLVQIAFRNKKCLFKQTWRLIDYRLIQVDAMKNKRLCLNGFDTWLTTDP